jgi:polyphenol oxidase
MIRWDGDHLAVVLPGAQGVFTTRRGGVSTGPYATLNLGDHVGDDPAAVAENRLRVAARAGRPWERFRHARQVHRRTVATGAERAGEADGQVVDSPEDAAMVFVADCLPILVAGEGAAAALHAGWRSLAAGIVAEGVEALRAAGARGRIEAALGPSARACCYEVGEEVHAALPGGRGRAPAGEAGGSRNLDLAAVARRHLDAAGVDWVHDAGLCTICSEASLFFSHRRDGGTTGRQAGAVWRA